LTTRRCGWDTRIRKEDIDSFINASGKPSFQRRVVIDTREKEWSPHAEAMIRGQAIPVTRIGLSDLRASRIDWSIFEARNEIVLEARKDLRPHQEEALQAVVGGLKEADRGKLIMACGTGKTFTALRIADPAYPLDLFRRVITVSLETMRIVRGLPALDIMEDREAA